MTMMNIYSIYVLNKLEGIMTAFKYLESMVFLLLTKQFTSHGLMK